MGFPLRRPTVAAVVLACCLSARGAVPVAQSLPGRARPSVVLHVPAMVDPSTLTIGYELSPIAMSGIQTKPAIHDYVLETVVDNKTATRLRVWAYAVGFGYTFADADLTSGPPSRTIDLTFTRLGTVTLRGRVPASRSRATARTVVANYTITWLGEFLHEMLDGGPYDEPRIASTPAAADGSFVLQVPDLANDPALANFSSRGALTFYAVDQHGQETTACFIPVAPAYSDPLTLFDEPCMRNVQIFPAEPISEQRVGGVAQ